MFEIFQNFEQIAQGLHPLVLIGQGLAAVLIGLFVWLGGLGFRKVLVTVTGAVSGAILGSFVIGSNTIMIMVLIVVGAVIAVIFQRIFIIILTAAIAAFIGFGVLANPYIENTRPAISTYQNETTTQGHTMSVNKSIEIVKAYTVDFAKKIKLACSQMPLQRWAIIAVLAIISIIFGFYLWNLTSALCFSTMGTTLIFGGMILLLMYKGAAPISSMRNKPLLYLGVFVAMTACGTLEQLLLCRSVAKHSTRKKQASNQKEEPVIAKQSWRKT